MIEEVVVVPYGRPASEALSAAVRAAKGGSALAPVTVLVGSNFAGLAARRLLGSGLVGSGGVANVGFFTPFRLAELLSADVLLDRRPLTNPVLGAAVRLTLAKDPGPFADVRDHVATEAALAALYSELSNVSDDGLDRIARGGGRAADAVALHRAIAERLDGFDAEADAARAAAGRSDLGRALAPFGHVVWYLPAPTTAPMAEFIGAVLAAAPSTVVVGATGDEQADSSVWRTLEQAGTPQDLVRDAVQRAGQLVAPTASHIISVTDADEEVRAVVRRIVELVEAGMPLDRIGVFHPTTDPYVGILGQQLAAARIPTNGPSRRRVTDSAAGRTLLRALELPAQRWRRDRVMALVSGAPIRHGDGFARPPTWESLSRDAGVVQDIGDWQRKLSSRRQHIDEWAASDRQRSAALPDGSDERARIERRLESLDRQRRDIDALADFVGGLHSRVTAVEQADGWAAKAGSATALLEYLLGQGHQRRVWPEPEQEAFDRVQDALARLATLDSIEPEPTHEVFVRALTAELDVTAGRHGRFGEGVTYGPLSAAVGHDLDAVFVLGCVEGLCPMPRREESLLPDSARELAGGALTLRSEHLHEQHRWFLSALASAPAHGRTLSFPRGDLRSSRASLPSRWLLDTASTLVGSPVYGTEFGELREPVVRFVPSHATGVTTAAVHGSVGERDVATLAAHVAAGGDPLGHPSAADAARGLLAQRQRRGDAFTEWDGNLTGQPIPSTDQVPLSATRLERWASCGFRYFLGDVLGLRERDEPERIVELSALDRGSAVHKALEDFLREVIADGSPEPDQPWTDDQHARLRQIAEAEFEALEEKGRTGRALHWRLASADLLAGLDELLHADDRYRSGTRARPEQVELPFGMDDREPVRIELPDGRTLSFRGRADRVDRVADDRVLVIDYKTGSGSKYKDKDFAEGDPVFGGELLQLALYAEAAVQQLGATRVAAHYWMVEPRTAFAQYGYEWTADRRARFVDVVTAIAEGIEGGVFPAHPGEWNSWRQTHDNCTYCEFDGVCLRARGEQAEAKAGAPEMVALTPLEWKADE